MGDPEEEGEASMLRDAERGVESSRLRLLMDRPFEVVGAEALRWEGCPMPMVDPPLFDPLGIGPATPFAPLPTTAWISTSDPEEVCLEDPRRPFPAEKSGNTLKGGGSFLINTSFSGSGDGRRGLVVGLTLLGILDGGKGCDMRFWRSGLRSA